MISKKYFSIAEVSEMTNIPDYKLRYIEKSNPNIEIVKIRGRRYYTLKDIEYINQKYSKKPSDTLFDTSKIISRIDNLINKLRDHITA